MMNELTCDKAHRPCIITIPVSGERKRYVLTHLERHGKLPDHLKLVLHCMSGQVNW